MIYETVVRELRIPNVVIKEMQVMIPGAPIMQRFVGTVKRWLREAGIDELYGYTMYPDKINDERVYRQYLPGELAEKWEGKT